MRSMTVILAALALTATVPAAAQQSLGEVAGSIKLKRPQGEPVVVDGSTLSRTSSPSRSSLGDDLGEVIADAQGAASGLASMLANLPRITSYLYSDEQRAQLDEFELRLETARNNVAMFFGADGVEQVVEKAASGVAEAQQALASAQAAVASASWVPNEVRRQAEHASKVLDDALRDMRKMDRAAAAAELPPPIDPIAADASIRGLCGQSFADGSDRYRECVARQQAAIDNIRGRSALASGLDDASFNTIRNQCRSEWVHDYVARDGCERRRVASAGGR